MIGNGVLLGVFSFTKSIMGVLDMSREFTSRYNQTAGVQFNVETTFPFAQLHYRPVGMRGGSSVG